MTRDQVPAKPLNPTPLNYKKVLIKVSDGMIKEAGIFTSNYVTYNVATDPLGYAVKRKDADFIFLRKILSKQFPYIIIPPVITRSNK